jgi:two-component system sensor histidine kinase YcbA
VKKDNLRIVRGLEQVVTESYDYEAMEMKDLIHILERSTRQLLGQQRADIRLECRLEGDVTLQEHYPVLSVLKNLVTNAVEAIQGASGKGTVWVDCRTREGDLLLTVKDDGPGITARGMKNLFQVGYSTKFDPGTGNINRGVGLPAVQYIVESLGGEIAVDSAPGEGTCFSVTIPLASVTGGNT